MRALTFLLAAALFACTTQEPVEQPTSPCVSQRFEGSGFTVCSEKGGSVEVRSGHRSFAQLQSSLGDRSERVAFAMNAGMFDDQGAPIGLLIEDGRQVHAINRRDGGGNFHLKPNGVMLIGRNGRVAVVESDRFKASPDVAYATQSGPMLVIDGKLHPKFDADGTSRYVRNGVGVRSDGTALFVISDEVVSLGKFARFFRDALKTPNALYLDGSVSSLWDPENGRMDSFTEIGPMVVVFKASVSAPGHASPAKP